MNTILLVLTSHAFKIPVAIGSGGLIKSYNGAERPNVGRRAPRYTNMGFGSSPVRICDLALPI